MKLKIEISLDNAAFEDNPEELREIFNKIEDQINELEEEQTRSVFNSNSNSVGYWEIKG